MKIANTPDLSSWWKHGNNSMLKPVAPFLEKPSYHVAKKETCRCNHGQYYSTAKQILEVIQAKDHPKS
jgi:hypothetical protein